MPIEVEIWKINDKPRRVDFSALESEAKLESILEKDLTILSSGLMLSLHEIEKCNSCVIAHSK